jgi:hypothetical protein
LGVLSACRFFEFSNDPRVSHSSLRQATEVTDRRVPSTLKPAFAAVPFEHATVDASSRRISRADAQIIDAFTSGALGRQAAKPCG